MAKVLRIFFGVGLLVVVLAGCGGGASKGSADQGVPRVLAQRWESEASAVATAASAGNSCRALRLANSLQTDVIAQQHRLPPRLGSPLLTGVNALASRISCTHVVTKPTPPHNPPPGPKPKPPKPHEPPGHGKGHDK